jgi:hypothetical protein
VHASVVDGEGIAAGVRNGKAHLVVRMAKSEFLQFIDAVTR